MEHTRGLEMRLLTSGGSRGLTVVVDSIDPLANQFIVGLGRRVNVLPRGNIVLNILLYAEAVVRNGMIGEGKEEEYHV